MVFSHSPTSVLEVPQNGALVLNEGYRGQVPFMQDEHSINEIMKSQGIPDLSIRPSLGVVEQAPPLLKFIDTTEAMVRQAHHNVDELPPSRQGARADKPLLRLL